MAYLTKSAMKALGLDPNKFNHSDERMQEKMAEIKKFIFDEKVVLVFIPSKELQTMIAQNDNQIAKDMPKDRKIELLSGHGIPIQKEMIYKWLTGKLDKRNQFILERGEIRIKENLNHTLIGQLKNGN